LLREEKDLSTSINCLFIAVHIRSQTAGRTLSQRGDYVRYGPIHISVDKIAGLQANYDVKANAQKSGFYGVLITFIRIQVPKRLSTTRYMRRKEIIVKISL